MAYQKRVCQRQGRDGRFLSAAARRAISDFRPRQWYVNWQRQQSRTHVTHSYCQNIYRNVGLCG